MSEKRYLQEPRPMPYARAAKHEERRRQEREAQKRAEERRRLEGRKPCP